MYRTTERPTTLVAEPTVSSPAAVYRDSGVDPGATPALSVALLGLDPVSVSTLRSLLGYSGLVKGVQEWASAKAAGVRIAQDVPDLVFMDATLTGDCDYPFAQQLARLRPAVHIVACTAHRESDPNLLLQAMRCGIRDFVEKPFDRAELSALLQRVSSEQAPVKVRPAATGKLFVVLGTKGGVGTSTVSVNLAVQLAQLRGKSAVLLDFSRPLGDVAALLDLKYSFQLRDALEQYKRLDATLLGGLLAAHRSGLRVLPGAARLEDWQQAPFEAIERVVEIAQQSFDFVVMDLGSNYSAEWKNVLQAAEVLLISEADLPGLAKLNRHLAALGNLQVASPQIRLVINRWHRQDEAALEKVEKGMRLPVFARLPNNFKQVSEATMRGDSLKQQGDALAVEFQKMAQRLAGAEPGKEAKKSRLGQFLSL